MSYWNHECTQHIVSWWYTHVPNMVSQCKTVKKFWAGHKSTQTDSFMCMLLCWTLGGHFDHPYYQRIEPNSYDFVKSTSIDYMHGVLLGITKLLINLWISSINSKDNFSISTYVDIIDEKILKFNHLHL